MHNNNIFLKNFTKRSSFDICTLTIGNVQFLICEEVFLECSLVSIFLLEKEEYIESFFASELVIENERFHAERIHFDTLGHADKISYFLENRQIVREISEFSFKKTCIKYTELIPVYFFESIKAENLIEAKNYLCKDLQEIEDDKFFDFFEDFAHLIFEKGKYFLLNGKFRTEAKFEILDNLIINFEIK